MFCSKCGKSNPDGAKFCKYCGNKFELINAPAVTSGVPARRVQVSKLNILVAAQVIVIALLIYAGKMLADRYYSPGYIASQYFECFMNGHPEKAYSYCIENSGTGFISKDMYCSVLGSGNKKVTSYKIKETDRGFSSARYKITYRVAGENKNYKMDVTVEDDKSSKKLFLFSNWKVNMSDFICKDYLVNAPETPIKKPGQSITRLMLFSMESILLKYIMFTSRMLKVNLIFQMMKQNNTISLIYI